MLYVVVLLCIIVLSDNTSTRSIMHMDILLLLANCMHTFFFQLVQHVSLLNIGISASAFDSFVYVLGFLHRFLSAFFRLRTDHQ